MDLNNIDLLILSDRYPPNAVGGAELSLHSVVREIPKYKNILVCSIYPNSYDQEMAYYNYENIDVMQLEPYADFPFCSLTLSQFQALSNDKPKSLESEKSSIMSECYEACLLYESPNEADNSFLLKYGLDEIIFTEKNVTFNTIRSLFQDVRIKVLHADNLRSIALSRAIRAERKIFTIRDNRFHENHFQENLSDFQMNILMSNFEYRLSLLDDADKIVVTSQFLLDSIQRVRPSHDYIKIPNPIDDLGVVQQYFANNTFNFSGFNIVIIGMLNENKGQVQFIKALKHKIKENPDIKIHFLGRGERIKKRILEISAEAGISEQIFLHDYLSRKETYQILAASQLVVLPTLWDEPFGRVPLEAGITKKAVVSFAVGGLKETIIDGQTGFLVDKGEYLDMFEKILILKNDANKREAFGQNAYAYFAKYYNPVEISKKYFSLWFDC